MFEARDYDTRLDQFRKRAGIGRGEWAIAAEISRSQLTKYRAGLGEPRAGHLARLVSSAGRILGRAVNASELFDLGEDEPLGKKRRPKPAKLTAADYDTRLDKLMRRLGVRPAALAKATGTSRMQIYCVRRGGNPLVSTVRSIVIAIRRMGHDVRARDVIDLGEE